MALTQLTADVENIQALSNTPNATEGLTPDQLKKKFDDAAIDIKAYLNETLTAEVDALISPIQTSLTGLKGTVLWTNADPTSSFAAQTITVSDMSDYNIIGIYFWRNNINDCLHEVRAKKGYGGSFSFHELGTTYIDSRYFLYTNTTSIEFKAGYLNTGVDNTRAIPMYVVGYKTGLFS